MESEKKMVLAVNTAGKKQRFEYVQSFEDTLKVKYNLYTNQSGKYGLYGIFIRVNGAMISIFSRDKYQSDKANVLSKLKESLTYNIISYKDKLKSEIKDYVNKAETEVVISWIAKPLWLSLFTGIDIDICNKAYDRRLVIANKRSDIKRKQRKDKLIEGIEKDRIEKQCHIDKIKEDIKNNTKIYPADMILIAKEVGLNIPIKTQGSFKKNTDNIHKDGYTAYSIKGRYTKYKTSPSKYYVMIQDILNKKISLIG